MPQRLKSQSVKTPDRGPELAATHISMLLLVIAAVSVRAYTRKFILKCKLRVDDFVILVAAVSLFGLFTVQTLDVLYAIRKQDWDIMSENFVSTSDTLILAASILYTITTSTTRLSILLFLVNINPYQTIARLIKIFISIVSLFMILSLVFLLLSSFHKIRIPVGWALLCSNLVLDFTVSLLPLMLISHVQVSLRKKIEIVVFMCVGILACVGSGIEIYYIHKLKRNPSDRDWYIVDIHKWCSIEVALGILSSCAPTAKQLFRHLRNKASSQNIMQSKSPRERAFEGANTFLTVPLQSNTQCLRTSPESSGTFLDRPEEFNCDLNSTQHVTGDLSLEIHERSICGTNVIRM